MRVAVAGIAALVVIVGGLWLFDVGPFEPGVDDLVSEELGTSARCKTLGVAEIAGARSKVYGCSARISGGDVIVCRAVIDGDVYSVSNNEYSGCGPA